MEKRELCAECGGRCCKSMSCEYIPSDFDLNNLEASIREKMDKGYLAINSFFPFEDDAYPKELQDFAKENNGTVPILTIVTRRIALNMEKILDKTSIEYIKDIYPIDLNDESVLCHIQDRYFSSFDKRRIDFAYSCALLNDKGCKLSYEERPYMAKSLIPSKDENGNFNCYSEDGSPFSSMKDAAVLWIPYQDLLYKLNEDPKYHSTIVYDHDKHSMINRLTGEEINM